MRILSCSGCEARSEEIAHLREQLAQAHAAAAQARTDFLAEQRNLSDKLTAVADARATAALRQAPPVKRPPMRAEDLKAPSYINSVIGGGHADMSEIRRRLSSQGPKDQVPEVAS